MRIPTKCFRKALSDARDRNFSFPSCLSSFLSPLSLFSLGWKEMNEQKLKFSFLNCPKSRQAFERHVGTPGKIVFCSLDVRTARSNDDFFFFFFTFEREKQALERQAKIKISVLWTFERQAFFFFFKITYQKIPILLIESSKQARPPPN